METVSDSFGPRERWLCASYSMVKLLWGSSKTISYVSILTKHDSHFFVSRYSMNTLLVVASYANESKSVTNKLTLHYLIKRGGTAQWREHIDFKQPWFQTFIYDNIKPVQLEARISVSRRTFIQGANNVGLYSNQCFNYHIFNLCKHEVITDSSALVSFSESRKAPLARTFLVLACPLIDLEILWLLVDREVGEMDESFLQVIWIQRIFLSCKSYKALIVHVYAQGVIASNENIHPQIILEFIYEVWFAYVLWSEEPIFPRHVSFLSDHLYATPTTSSHRL